jgi:hypothetical protein
MGTEYGTGFGPQSSSLSPLSLPGAVAQLGEHLVCNQGVVGSIPISSTNSATQLPLLVTSRDVPARQRMSRNAGLPLSGYWSYRSNETTKRAARPLGPSVSRQAVSTIVRDCVQRWSSRLWFH